MEAFSILLDAVIKEALEGIVDKIREGKKLTDSEVLLLVVSQLRREQEMIREGLKELKLDMYRRFDDVDSLMKLINALSRWIRDSSCWSLKLSSCGRSS